VVVVEGVTVLLLPVPKPLLQVTILGLEQPVAVSVEVPPNGTVVGLAERVGAEGGVQLLTVTLTFVPELWQVPPRTQ
jgi:hypothetical protein